MVAFTGRSQSSPEKVLSSFQKQLKIYYQQKESRWITDAEKKKLESYLQKVGRRSYEYQLIQYTLDYVAGEVNLKLLEQMDKEFPLKNDHLHILLDAYVIENKAFKRKEVSRKIYNAGLIDKGILEYHNNVLQSCPTNAFLFTFGYDDTYALRILQDVKGTRTDVTILSIDLLKNDTYRKFAVSKLGVSNNSTIVKNTKSVLKSWMTVSKEVTCITLTYPVSYFTSIGLDHLYNVGLIYQYSNNTIDVSSVITDNWGKFSLAYFTTQTSVTQRALNRNYFMPLFTWYRALDSGNKLRRSIQYRIKILVKFTGKTDEINRLIFNE